MDPTGDHGARTPVAALFEDQSPSPSGVAAFVGMDSRGSGRWDLITKVLAHATRLVTATSAASTYAPEERAPGITIAIAHSKYERRTATTPRRLPGPRRLHQDMITGAAQMDGAILVVAAPEGRCRRPASTSCWRARSKCRACRVPQQGDQMDDPELLDLVSWSCANCSASRASRR